MSTEKETMHSFIVRVWIESTELEPADAQWRGMIEHVLSRERQYLLDLDDLEAFIRPYLSEMGVSCPKRSVLKKMWSKLCHPSRKTV
jgi:hypothetical protein